MNPTILSAPLASLALDGVVFSLIPAQIKSDGDVFTVRLGTLTATLTVHTFDNGFDTLLRLTNTGAEDSPRITDVKMLLPPLSCTAADAVLETLTGDDCGEKSFLPVREVIADGSRYHAEPYGGRSSNTTAFPYFDLIHDGGCTTFGIGWTGQWRMDLARIGHIINVSAGLCDCDFYLKPGESVRFPSIIAVTGETLESTRVLFRRTLADRFTPRPNGERPVLPISIQPFDRYYAGQCDTEIRVDWKTEAGQICEADRAAECGHIDTLWIDAAWMKVGFPSGMGNFSCCDGFPNGLAPVAKRVHEHGMRFVVWVEPERVCHGTELWEEHPEFLLHYHEDWDALYDLSSDAAREWLTDRLARLIEEYGIDVYRQDFNMDPLPYWRAHDEEGRKGITELHYVEGLYRMWDSLLARFPHLLIDNCSSGGRRLDAETVRRSVTLWRSDTGCSPEHENFPTSVWNNLQTLALGRYLPYTCIAVWTADAYDVRGAFTGGLACNFDILNDNFDMDGARAILAECDRVRPLWQGDFYPLTAPDLATDNWAAYQLHRDGKGYCCFFRKIDAETDTFTAALRTVDEQKTYRLTCSDEHLNKTERTVSGRELAALTVTIPGKRESLVVEYEEA